MYETIKYLYPNATDMDFQLRDDGDGIYLDFWNEAKLGAKPEMAFIVSKIQEVKELLEEKRHTEELGKQALLEKLGITEEEAKLLLS